VQSKPPPILSALWLHATVLGIVILAEAIGIGRV